MTQFQTALPTLLTHQLESRPPIDTIKVFAQDETRLGLLPIVRRRITARGVQPVATVMHQFDNFYLYGAVEPITGASFFLELPSLNSQAFQRWLDGFAAAFPESLNCLVLDNGAGHTAKAVRWPSNVLPIFLPPYSPELNRSNGSGGTSKTNWLTALSRPSMSCQRPYVISFKTTPALPCNH